MGPHPPQPPMGPHPPSYRYASSTRASPPPRSSTTLCRWVGQRLLPPRDPTCSSPHGTPRPLQRHAREVAKLHLLVVPPPTTTPAPTTTHAPAPSVQPPPPEPPPPLAAPPLPARPASAPSADTAPQPPSLQQDVAEYLLDVLRERRAAGCFSPVYPSARHHAAHGEQLERMARSCAEQPTTTRGEPGIPPPADTRRTTCGSARRLQMHALLGIVLRDLDNSGRSTPFRERCERVLSAVPTAREGSWARRTHIFGTVSDLVS
jgi:hypothetical protein